jgi:hypothetical protein
MEVGIYEGGEFIWGDHPGAVDSQTSLPEMGWDEALLEMGWDDALPEMGWEALPEIGWDEDLTHKIGWGDYGLLEDSQFQINGAQARSSTENFQSLLPGSTEFQYTLLMENDPLSPHDLRNEDPSERRSEPYLCSEDFSTKNFGRDVLPCSLCKNYDENASYTGRDPELTGNWYCKGCRPCSICGDSKGDFLLCDTCDGAYHLLCAGISTTPDEDEDWHCTNCLEGVIASLGRKEKRKSPRIKS